MKDIKILIDKEKECFTGYFEQFPEERYSHETVEGLKMEITHLSGFFIMSHFSEFPDYERTDFEIEILESQGGISPEDDNDLYKLTYKEIFQ